MKNMDEHMEKAIPEFKEFKANLLKILPGLELPKGKEFFTWSEKLAKELGEASQSYFRKELTTEKYQESLGQILKGCGFSPPSYYLVKPDFVAGDLFNLSGKYLMALRKFEFELEVKSARVRINYERPRGKVLECFGI